MCGRRGKCTDIRKGRKAQPERDRVPVHREGRDNNRFRGGRHNGVGKKVGIVCPPPVPPFLLWGIWHEWEEMSSVPCPSSGMGKTAQTKEGSRHPVCPIMKGSTEKEREGDRGHAATVCLS